MKIVLYYHVSKSDINRVMEIVKETGCVIDNTLSNEDIMNDLNNIYFVYEKEKKIYKFNRYDTLFIEKVEHALQTNPYYHYPGNNYEGPFMIYDLDDRFLDQYTIKKLSLYKETVEIEKDSIIEKLYADLEYQKNNK